MLRFSVQIMCDGVTKDNLPVQFVATTEGSYYQCQLSGTWNNPQAAGIAAVDCAQGPSHATNIEYGGNVYQSNDGAYSFTLPKEGSEGGYPYDPTAVPANTTFEAPYHTHGGEIADTYERFSPFYVHPNQLGDIGIAMTAREQKPWYLGTPSGRIEVFNPSSALQYPNGCVLVGPVVPAGSGVYAYEVPKCH